MKAFDPALAEHLFEQATTICTCWIVRRQDGDVSGYTDHDNPITIEGVSCLASSGFQPTEAVSELGLATDHQDIEGALHSGALTASDLRSGRYDNARVEIWMVNWAAPEQRHHMRTAVVGEITREDGIFRAELRGLTSLLGQRVGRTYSRRCDAIVGDARCGINLESSTYKASGVVIEISDHLSFSCNGLNAFDSGWFERGNLEWTTGPNAGLKVEMSSHRNEGTVTLSLWNAMPEAPQIGDAFVATVGCDKSFTMCKARFSNQTNFRGFPHIPGSDFALGYADKATIHDGRPLIL